MKALLFTSPTCKACPAMKRNLAAAGIKFDELDVNVRENWAIAGLYQVKSLPTLVVVDGWRPIESLVGAHPLLQLLHLKSRRSL